VGASPVAGGNLTATGPGASLAYDSHGNTTRLADQTLIYDVADRHIGTVLDDDTTITYLLDSAGRMVARTVANSPDGDENGTIRYLAGGGIADGSGAVLQWVVSLPGGVSVALDADGSQRWGFPNLHGDVIVATDGDGHRVGVRSVYDPFGQPIDADTWAIGTTDADDDIPDLLVGDADFGWVGQHAKYTEHHGSIHTISMGARLYVPALGRFLEVDPVEGGVTNAYDYPADPVNGFDLTGEATNRLAHDSSGGDGEMHCAYRHERCMVQVLVKYQRPPGGRQSRGGSFGTASKGTDGQEGFLRGCVFACIEPAVLHYDSALYGQITVGGGAEVGLSGGGGLASNKGPGLSVGIQCLVSAGPGGIYGGGGANLWDGNWAWDPSAFGEVGYAVGAAAGCSVGVTYTWMIVEWW
jgi:RHS repeat-associated protein